MKFRLLVVLFAFFSIASNAQEEEEFRIKPTLNLGLHANLKDFYFDVGGGAEEQKSRIGLQLNFAFRPFYKKVQTHVSDNVIRQWKEKKYFISLDAYKRLLKFQMGPKTEAHFLVGAKTGYLFGDYLGTKQRPDDGITVNPFGGIGFNLNGVYCHICMLVFNDKLASVGNQRLMVQFNFPLKND